ncbi:MAG: 7-cyano-7-deazaguanine synthase [Clostridiales bacterium]|nr:7-cyano-7-deazaguanine synthase [Clostridiales bacterium]
MKKAIIPLSGGADSSTCMALAKSKGYDVYAMFIDYGQNNIMHELQASKAIAEHYGAKDFKILKFDWFKEVGGSGLVDKTYMNGDNKVLEYVPFRNTVILSLAMAWADSIKADAIFYGSTGAPWITPDNSPEYFDAFRQVAAIGAMKKDIEIFSPFNRMKKAEVVELGLDLNVPYEKTWSCHNNKEKHCGECSQCLDRKRAFESLGLVDPVFKGE